MQPAYHECLIPSAARHSGRKTPISTSQGMLSDFHARRRRAPDGCLHVRSSRSPIHFSTSIGPPVGLFIGLSAISHSETHAACRRSPPLPQIKNPLRSTARLKSVRQGEDALHLQSHDLTPAE